ncbi:hypothetical protein FS749_011915 [Ceratobasidium sp. UAMH 11750]|nr:hypothetical protein FS749_011915 [Ceratobasidium sp. UAMH 11750]
MRWYAILVENSTLSASERPPSTRTVVVRRSVLVHVQPARRTLAIPPCLIVAVPLSPVHIPVNTAPTAFVVQINQRLALLSLAASSHIPTIRDPALRLGTHRIQPGLELTGPTPYLVVQRMRPRE